MNSKIQYNLVVAYSNVGTEVANPGTRPLQTLIEETPAISPL